MVFWLVERAKTLPPPRTRTGPLAFFGNGGGCFHSYKKIKKDLVLRPKLPILSGMEMTNTNQEALKLKLRNSYLASMFEYLLETAHHSLPFSVTVEQEKAFRKALDERIAKAQAGAEQFVQDYTK